MSQRPAPAAGLGQMIGVWAIGPEQTLARLPFREETVDGEHRIYVTESDVTAAQQRARVKAGRFGTPRRSRRSPLAD